MKTLISLIGEQPIPNLLPVLHLKPEQNILFYSDLTDTAARKLQKLLNIPDKDKVKIDAYDIDTTRNKVLSKIDDTNDTTLNITGGTKLMSLALFQAALEKKIKFVYLQSEENQNILFNYDINENGITCNKTVLPELISVDLYLKAHLFEYSNLSVEKGSGYDFENLICKTLRENDFEVIQNIKPKGEGNKLEIDAVIRRKGTNNVGICEIKTGDAKEEGPKKGIDQLGLASQREYLGTYTKRFLITSRMLSKEIKELAKAHKVIIIDGIEQKRNNNELTNESIFKLVQRIKEKLS